jgi:hypothetical protein
MPGQQSWQRSEHTAISCRNTKISRSFEASLRASSASQANERDTARYTRRKSTSAEDRSPAQMLSTNSGTRQVVELDGAIYTRVVHGPGMVQGGDEERCVAFRRLLAGWCADSHARMLA